MAYPLLRRPTPVILSLVGSLSAAIGHGVMAPQAIAGSFISSTTPGSVVTPSVVDVYLEPDDSVTFRVEVDPYSSTALDVFLLNDVSASFGDDLPNVSAAVPNLMTGLSNTVGDVQFGLGSFSDKTIFPFGGWVADPDGNNRYSPTPDYPYQTEQALTGDMGKFQTAVNGLELQSGLDLPESQLEALLQVALRSKTELGFRDEAFKTVVLQTDAPFHFVGETRQYADGTPYTYYSLNEAGAVESRSSLNPNNGDTVFDPWEDYPAIAQVRNALIDASIVPIFAVTAEVRHHYDDLVSQLGFGEVVILSSDSSNLVSAIQEGIGNALDDVTLVVEGDDFDYVRQVASDVSSEKEGTDKDVPFGETAKFDVTLEDKSGDSLTGNDTLKLTALGYGGTTVNVTVPKPKQAPQRVPEPGMAIAVLGAGLWGMLKGRRRPQGEPPESKQKD